tara:strand:- start:81 stop:551 length:471 start_codon:yes stop_codon:yes gene_type:complete
MKKLKKQIKFFKNYTLFSQNKVLFFCLLDNHKNYFDLRSQLISANFKIKFIQNGFLKSLPYFLNIKKYLTGQIFCVLKDKLEYDDYLILKNLLFENAHVILFYLDNKFYSASKLGFFNKFLRSKINKLPYLSYFYFLLKLGFILKIEKIQSKSIKE